MRRLCSTPSRISAAILRAARPGTSVGGANLEEVIRKKHSLAEKARRTVAVKWDRWHGNMPNVRIDSSMNRLVYNHTFEKCERRPTLPPDPVIRCRLWP